MRYFILMVGLMLASIPLLAQGFGRMPMMNMGGGNTVMVSSTKGLFALRNGVIVKYTISPFQQAQELQLFGAAPQAPTDTTDQAAMQKYYADVQRRVASAIMLVKDNSLLVVIGDGFARINQDTLAVEATGDLRSQEAIDGIATTGRNAMALAEGAVSYLLVDNTLYLMRGTEMLAISITDGKATHVALPKELQPMQMAMPQMGNRGGNAQGGNGQQGGNWGGRGNRGNRQGGNQDGNQDGNPPQN
ncbi:MAG TPA: hypothetical protein VHV83_00890 [Armatimonadota bacterium]|nr:hypothetical protein [Armatimonadota bacterium]